MFSSNSIARSNPHDCHEISPAVMDAGLTAVEVLMLGILGYTLLGVGEPQQQIVTPPHPIPKLSSHTFKLPSNDVLTLAGCVAGGLLFGFLYIRGGR